MHPILKQEFVPDPGYKSEWEGIEKTKRGEPGRARDKEKRYTLEWGPDRIVMRQTLKKELMQQQPGPTSFTKPAKTFWWNSGHKRITGWQKNNAYVPTSYMTVSVTRYLYIPSSTVSDTKLAPGIAS